MDLLASGGALNPAGLGDADAVSGASGFGQSSVGFDTLAAYKAADAIGLSPYGGAAEYGIVRTAAAAAVCDKISALHGGSGAIICPSGLAAITTTIDAFAPRAIAVPDTVYGPVIRYTDWLNKANRHRIIVHEYPGAASAMDVELLIETAGRSGTAIDMIYLEAPVSGTFAIPDIAGIAHFAKQRGIRTVMDNTWASHVRLRPIEHGIDIVIQATTKYEGGYADTPSGAIIARDPRDSEILARAQRVSGNGAIAPQVCRRLFHRIDSTHERMDRHYDSALSIMAWLQAQPYVADILCPALKTSPDHDRFLQYFDKGNGLFTVMFQPNVSSAQAELFMDCLCLFRIAESWGGHVSLVLPVKAKAYRGQQARAGAPQPGTPFEALVARRLRPEPLGPVGVEAADDFGRLGRRARRKHHHVTCAKPEAHGRARWSASPAHV